MADKQTVEYNYYPISLAVSEIDKNVASNSPAVPLSGENIATVGGASILQSNYMQSTNYSKGNSGWRINAAGDVEFGNGYFRGDITGASGTFSGTLSAATILYGKTSFTDTAAGYFISPLGLYVGALNDTTRLKYTVADGSIDFIGSHSSGSIGGVAVGYVVQISTSTADIVPLNFAISETGVVSADDGTQTAYVTLTWTAISSDTFNYYKIRYKKNSFTYYTYINTIENTITIEGLTPNTSYDFAVASVNKFGTESAYTATVTSSSAATTVPPETVVVDSATGGIQYVILEWTNSTSTDIASYNIYRNTVNNSATATLVGNSKTNYFVDGGRTGGIEYFYWVKAVNTSGLVSAAFSIAQSATPRDVTNDDIVTIAGTKVLIDGVVYLSNWRKVGDLTMIDGGSISTGTVTTTQLNFTPVQGTDVIASINASAEGITIDADNLTINAATTFSAGYDPTSKVTTFAQDGIPTSIASGDIWIDTNDDNKMYRADSAGADQITAGEWVLVETSATTTFAQDEIPTALTAGDIWVDTNDGNKMYRATNAGDDQITAGEWVAVPDGNKLDLLGGSYDTAASGARVRIFPDANTGIQIIDDAAGDVFKAEVGGANVGDVTIGGATKYVKWDKSESELEIVADDVTLNGSSLTFQNIYGDGSDGTVTVNSNTTMTEDWYCSSLTVDSGFTLNTGGYRLFVKNTLTNNGTISRDGNAGGDGAVGTPHMYTGGVGGTAGAALGAGFYAAGVVGVAGGNGGDGGYIGAGSGSSGGTVGTASTNSLGTNGSAGNTGGAGGASVQTSTGSPSYSGGGVGAGGAGGTATAATTKPKTLVETLLMRNFEPSTPTKLNIGANTGGASGGGGGGGFNTDPQCQGGGGGGAGGTGSTGGTAAILARIIVNTGTISVLGGAGGDGANGKDSEVQSSTYAGGGGGGGGGGTGGSGGILILVYSLLTDTGTISVAGGAGGTGGTGGAAGVGTPNTYPAVAGTNGNTGTTGASGVLIQLES